MTQTAEPSPPSMAPQPAQPASAAGSSGWLRVASVLACAALGFLLVTQLRATEDVGERLDVERE